MEKYEFLLSDSNTGLLAAWEELENSLIDHQASLVC